MNIGIHILLSESKL